MVSLYWLIQLLINQSINTDFVLFVHFNIAEVEDGLTSSSDYPLGISYSLIDVVT
jgi:hypothetical protein